MQDNEHKYATVFEENIPAELKRLEQWVCWRGEWSGEKLNKPPKQPNGNAASSTDERTWSTFDHALSGVRRWKRYGVGFAGLERTPYTGIDLDGCIEAGEIHPSAQEIVDHFGSYTEITPTGTGLRIWIEAEKVPTWSANKGGEIDIEVYSRGRFFTVTGRHLGGTPRTIDRRQAELDAFMRDYAPPKREQRVREPYKGPTGDYVFDLDRFLEEFGVEVKGPYNDNTSERAYRIVCPWVHEHTGGDDSGTRVGQYESGAPWFHCDHAHCRDVRRWEEFREELDPEAYRRVKFTVGGKKRSKSTDSASPTDPPQPGRFERIDLGEPIESGVDPAEMLVEDVLYAGSVHGIYSAGGKGKTFFALWLIKQVIQQDKPVMLLDQENGVRIISERLRVLGVSADEVRRNLYYYPFPSVPLEDEASAEFEALLDEVKPELVIFDSWINFLASAGLDENSSVDIAQWADAYSQRARQRGIAVLLLDHIPKDGNTARGSGRKLDYVDVMWELTKPLDFDRETVGKIELRLKKDREGWMPRGVAFTVGAKDDKLVFGRTAFDKSISTSGSLLDGERVALDALRSFGGTGARDVAWKDESQKRGLKRTTYYRHRGTLLERGLVEEVMGKYFYVFPANEESDLVPRESHGTGGTTANTQESHQSHHPKGGTSGTAQAGTSYESVEKPFLDDEGEL
jgi:AAA domain